jgi:hypothetical protein
MAITVFDSGAIPTDRRLELDAAVVAPMKFIVHIADYPIGEQENDLNFKFHQRCEPSVDVREIARR